VRADSVDIAMGGGFHFRTGLSGRWRFRWVLARAR
jgi:hypothetical protein